MDNRIDKIKFHEPKFKKMVLDFLKQQTGGVSLAQITVATALQSEWIEYILRLLMCEYTCQVRLNEKDKTARYYFDFSQKRANFWEKYGFIFSFFYNVLATLWVLIALAFMMMYMFVGGVVLGMIVVFNYPIMFIVTILIAFFVDVLAFEKKVYSYQDDFLAAIFGHKILSLDFLSLRDTLQFFWKGRQDKLTIEKRLLEYITQNAGKITTAEIMQLTGWQLTKANIEATQLVGQYNGDIRISEKGIIEYVFENLAGKAQDTSYIPRIWATYIRPHKLCYLNISQFWDMLWRVLVYVIYTTGMVSGLMLLAIYNTRGKKNDEMWNWIIFMSLPIFILLLGYVLMFVRYVWYSYLNISIYRENLSRKIIEKISKSKDKTLKIADIESSVSAGRQAFIQKKILAMGGEPRINEQNETYYYFEEFALADIKEVQTFKKVILDEQFTKNNAAWPEKNDENVKLKIENGKYHFRHKRKEDAWYTQLCVPLDTSKNYFKIETAMQYTGQNEENGYGLIWGKLDNKNDYNTKITIKLRNKYVSIA
jgi:hypothetical protein